ncbi:cytochrome c peroxidase [Reichenbachiella sp. MALMAid0571]|uniref:cytochrome-c peroxidase n=1 Tax=Reichenbachiella sp. MALMAid0571 TaxID=3143939 RepID=UPI0032DE2F98
MNRLILQILTIGLWLVSCGGDNSNQITAPTPYNLDVPFYFGENYELPKENPLTIEGVELGRMLFYEKKLSRDNTISCSSCHQQDKAFTDGLPVSIGIDGQHLTKSAMSLVNMPWSSHFFWNGRAESLEVQALEPIENPLEMDQSLDETVSKLQNTEIYPDRFFKAFGNKTITTENIGKALAQFQRTLISANSKYDKYIVGDAELTEQESLGMELFFTHPEPSSSIRGGNCGDCHVNFLTSGVNDNFDGFKNNGLDNDSGLEDGLAAVTGFPSDKGKFKVPSLRNIALTAPYMHDGRFSTLEEVLDHYNEGIIRSETLDPLILAASNENIVPNEDIKLHLTDEEKEAIIAFLKTLTDYNFITDEKFSDPF